MLIKPLNDLLWSRKFMLLVFDTIISILLYFFADVPNVEFLIGALQPVFVALIYSIAVEDAAEKSA